MKDLKDFNLIELEAVLRDWNIPSFHARQIFVWVYQKDAFHFDSMSNLPLELRRKLKENFSIPGLKVAQRRISRDGTEKFLFELKDKQYIEAALIPAKNRVTACLSSQAGCKFSCSFCASGLSGFKKDLSVAEIMEQVLSLRNHSPDKKLTHIVFMGTGEPLDNYEAVLKSIRIINSDYSLNIGARRITISTCGIIPGINRLAGEGLQVELSVSLHAAEEKLRTALMPINKKYPLKELIAACKGYIKKTNRQITFEYILMKGINSDLQNARELGKMLKGLKLCKVNLIAANPIAELKIQPPEKKEILSFRNSLIKNGIPATLRVSRGEDVQAACGQLRLRHEKNISQP
ncbi:MAG: 23S rRNA (adenine(2503)-C(2))-methyltransferase RlmN [Candidatus Omnitrophota bacterium]